MALPMDFLPAATSTILLSMRHCFPCVAAAPRSPPPQWRTRPSHIWQIDLRPMAEVADAPHRAVRGVSTSPPHIRLSAGGSDDSEWHCSSPMLRPTPSIPPPPETKGGGFNWQSRGRDFV
ncbi:hypothetical protein VPH35_051129 [Triticum aestivum]